MVEAVLGPFAGLQVVRQADVESLETDVTGLQHMLSLAQTDATRLDAENSTQAATIATLEDQESALNTKILALQTQLSQFAQQASQNAQLSPTMQAAQSYWNSKLPLATISYGDRLVPGTSNTLDMDIRLPCQPSDPFLKAWIAQNNLVVQDPANCDATVMSIYRLHQQTWMQYNQLPIWGALEYWCFPFEMRARVAAGLGAVCHDFAPSLISALVTAGVPAFRVRGLVGTTFQNEGHSTISVLADDLKTWRNVNSTSPANTLPATFDELPVWNDPKGPCAIQTPWFSYSTECCWNSTDLSGEPTFQAVMGGKVKVQPA